MASSISNWPIRKTQNQIILVPPHTCVLRVLIENNSNLNVWKLSIADIPYKNNYILVPPPPTQLGVEGSVYLKVRGTVGRYQSLYGRPLYDKLMPDHCRTLDMKLGLNCA